VAVSANEQPEPRQPNADNFLKKALDQPAALATRKLEHGGLQYQLYRLRNFPLQPFPTQPVTVPRRSRNHLSVSCLQPCDVRRATYLSPSPAPPRHPVGSKASTTSRGQGSLHPRSPRAPGSTLPIPASICLLELVHTQTFDISIDLLRVASRQPTLVSAFTERHLPRRHKLALTDTLFPPSTVWPGDCDSALS
jgi:hypothetical protein